MWEVLLLLLGAFVAAAISGAAGFGGALLLLPLLTLTVGVDSAVPLLTLAQLVGNISRAAFGFRHIQWRSVGLFLTGALPAAVLGAFSFIAIPATVSVRIIGVAILGMLMAKVMLRSRFVAGPRTMLFGGMLTGFLSGLAGSAGPLGAAFFLSLGLPPVAYIASEATSALSLHAVKTVVYQHHFSLSPREWMLALGLGLAMVLGSWVSKRSIERLDPAAFRWWVTGLLGALALGMVIGG